MAILKLTDPRYPGPRRLTFCPLPTATSAGGSSGAHLTDRPASNERSRCGFRV